MRRLKEIHEAKMMRKPEVSGYVKNIGKNRFVLLPTFLTPQEYLSCVCAGGVVQPRENDYIRIVGHTSYSSVRTLEIIVDDWLPDKPELPQIDVMAFKDFKEEVFARFLNVEPLIQDLLAYQIISSPPLSNQIGGLNICMYDSTKERLALRMIRDFQRIVPSDIGKPFKIKLPTGGRFVVKYKYTFIPGNADHLLSPRIRKALQEKTNFRSFQEISVSLGSKKDMPRTLTEPPVGLSDFPTVLNEQTDVSRKKLDPSLEAFKYMLVHQMYTPTVPEIDSMMTDIQDRLLKLQESYDVAKHQVSRYGILDTSCWGKSSAVLKLTLARARAQGLNEISSDEVRGTFKEYFVKNFENVHEVWNDLFRKEGLSLLELSRDEREIFRIVEKLQSSKECVPFKTISKELSQIKEYALEALINDLSNKGWLIERKPMCYKALTL
jgi:hypothetical protein